MALPLSVSPIFSMTIPSTDKVVKYRPFVIRDEKALLIAQQSEDPNVMIDTLKDVIKSCLKDNVDIDTLATFDLEYMFTQIRAKSVGETIDLIFPCDNDHGADNEKAKTKITFDLTEIKVDKPAGHNKKIELFGDVGVVMQYPTINVIRRIQESQGTNLNEIFGVVVDCVDYIYEGDEIYYSKEQKREELLQFLENLTSDQFSKIQQFFDTMPRIKQDVNYTCSICKKQHHKVLEGLASFF